MRLDRAVRRLTLALGLALVLAPAWSAPPALDTLIERLPPGPQARLREQWMQWRAWTPQQQADYARRAAAWDALPRAQRDARRERYLAWQLLSPEDRARAQQAGARFAAMPADQQQAWRAQFDALDRSQQRGWLLGPTLGVDYDPLQPLLAQLPEADHAPLMQALRTMSPQQRHDLGVLVQRTPPAQRETLRRGLLAAGAAGRGDWLWNQMQH